MKRIFVSSSPSKLSDQELAEHASSLAGHIKGNTIVGLIMLIVGIGLSVQSEVFTFYSFFAGLGGGFFMAQDRLAVLAQRIKRLEEQVGVKNV